MNTDMNMPGFTAEAALFNAKKHYQAAEQAATYSGTVHPALLPRRLYCLKFDYDCDGSGHCIVTTEVGIVNPITHECE
jgi:hypothetical protein